MPKRILQGVVISDKMDKTVVVQVERRRMHSKYKKYIMSSKKYFAHNENNQYKVGDLVKIAECRPRSKNKCWEVISEEDLKTDKTFNLKEQKNDTDANQPGCCR